MLLLTPAPVGAGSLAPLACCNTTSRPGLHACMADIRHLLDLLCPKHHPAATQVWKIVSQVRMNCHASRPANLTIKIRLIY